MKGGTTITKDNINRVYGQLNKFFKAHDCVESWHNFSYCVHKRVRRKVELSNHHWVDCVRHYHGVELELHEDRIAIFPCKGEGISIHIGNKVWFKGNHIILQNDCVLGITNTNYTNTYYVFQAA